MQPIEAAVAETARSSGFSGVVRVDRGGRTELEVAHGLADRAHGIPNRVDTIFGLASGAKPLTAVVVLRLVEQGVLHLGTTARSLLGRDLPLVADDVTVEHLLAHRSGIGDYLDETAVDVTDHVLPVPVHTLASTADYLPVLDGHPQVFPAGTAFAYNNAGYVLLALLAERATGSTLQELVRTIVCDPAGMRDTAFLRLDELPGRAAIGYLTREGLRSNVLHLPVLGSGDGGVYSTAADVSALWTALLDGRIVSQRTVAEMVRPRSDWPAEDRRYGLGLHLDATGDGVFIEGSDAGVSFASWRLPSAGLTCTVISNWSRGAWPMVRMLREAFER
jgi:CubicO group peptidase (beta-lactamase class C family)